MTCTRWCRQSAMWTLRRRSGLWSAERLCVGGGPGRRLCGGSSFDYFLACSRLDWGVVGWDEGGLVPLVANRM